MTLRGLSKSPINFLKAIYNVIIMRNYDNYMRKRKGQAWIDYKNKRALTDTHKKLGIK
jgi:hypothetical protein